jgi:hypothetical protein
MSGTFINDLYLCGHYCGEFVQYMRRTERRSEVQRNYASFKPTLALRARISAGGAFRSATPVATPFSGVKTTPVRVRTSRKAAMVLVLRASRTDRFDSILSTSSGLAFQHEPRATAQLMHLVALLPKE